MYQYINGGLLIAKWLYSRFSFLRIDILRTGVAYTVYLVETIHELIVTTLWWILNHDTHT